MSLLQRFKETQLLTFAFSCAVDSFVDVPVKGQLIGCIEWNAVEKSRHAEHTSRGGLVTRPDNPIGTLELP